MRRFWLAVARYAARRAGDYVVRPYQRDGSWTVSPPTFTSSSVSTTWNYK